MYSREKRMRTVGLYLKYGKSAADVIRELGYPVRHTLRSCYEMYLEEQETGVVRDRYSSAPKFTEEWKWIKTASGKEINGTPNCFGCPPAVSRRRSFFPSSGARR